MSKTEKRVGLADVVKQADKMRPRQAVKMSSEITDLRKAIISNKETAIGFSTAAAEGVIKQSVAKRDWGKLTTSIFNGADGCNDRDWRTTKLMWTEKANSGDVWLRQLVEWVSETFKDPYVKSAVATASAKGETIDPETVRKSLDKEVQRIKANDAKRERIEKGEEEPTTQKKSTDVYAGLEKHLLGFCRAFDRATEGGFSNKKMSEAYAFLTAHVVAHDPNKNAKKK